MEDSYQSQWANLDVTNHFASLLQIQQNLSGIDNSSEHSGDEYIPDLREQTEAANTWYFFTSVSKNTLQSKRSLFFDNSVYKSHINDAMPANYGSK